MPVFLLKYAFVIIFVVLSLYGKTQDEKVVTGQSSTILNNSKDIYHDKNTLVREKLINDAIMLAIQQAIPTTYTIEFTRIQDYDEANPGEHATDRFIYTSKSGKVVEWKQKGSPKLTRDLRVSKKWNCSVEGYVKELEKPPPTRNINTQVKNDSHTNLGYTWGIGYGLSLPQVFKVPLDGYAPDGEMPEWEAQINPLQFVGVNFGVGRELMLGIGFQWSNIKLITDSIELKTECVGGRVQFGMLRRWINPYFAIFALYGSQEQNTFAIKGLSIGIDFLKGKFKLGIEACGYWFSSNYEEDGVHFRNNAMFELNSFNPQGLRFNLGVSAKWYLF